MGISKKERSVKPSALIFKEISFQIRLDSSTWDTLNPQDKECKDGRIYKQFTDSSNSEASWSDIFYYLIYKETRLPCPFGFKRHRFYQKKDYPFFSLSGKCRECKNAVLVYCKKKPNLNNEDYELDIYTGDTRGVKHKTKRFLSKKKRNAIKKILLRERVKSYRDRIANKVLTNSGNNIELLDDADVLQTARHEAIDEDLGLKSYPGDVIQSVYKMSYERTDIRKFSTIPLILYYWSNNQIDFAEKIAAKKSTVSIDASGRFVLPIEISPGIKTGHLFFYNVVVRIDGDIFTLCQMISDRHDVSVISQWLMIWLKSCDGIGPSEIVVDCSLALLNAIAFAFNGCYFRSYLNKCFNLIKNKNQHNTNSNNKVPRCFIRRDRNHLISAVSRWNCFKKMDWTKKDFILRVIAYSLHIENLDSLKYIIQSLFIICMSSGSTCMKRINELYEKISTLKYDELYGDNKAHAGQEQSSDSDNNQDYDYLKFDPKNINNNNDDIYQYIYKIYNDCLPECVTCNDDSFIQSVQRRLHRQVQKTATR